MTLRILPEWEPQKRPRHCTADDALDMASTCTLRVFAQHPEPGGTTREPAAPLTRLVDHRQVPADGPRVSAYRFAEWLVWHWWRLRWEPLPPETVRPMSWREAHETTSIGGGWLWPHLTFDCDGEFMTVGSQSSEATESEPVTYFGDQEHLMPAKSFELGLDDFVNAVLDRLEAEGLSKNPLTDMWRELAHERNEDSATEYRRIEALLGCNPDEAPADLVNEHLEVAKIVGDRAADEIAAQPVLRGKSTSWFSPRSLRAWGYFARFRGDSPPLAKTTAAVQLESFVYDGSTLPWHHIGRKLANTIRESEQLGEGAIDDERLADVAGIRRTFLQHSNQADGLPPISYIWANEERRYVSLRPLARTERRFDAARLLGDTLYWSDHEPLRLAAGTRTFRQKVQRAFAEELLCPMASLVEMVGINPTQPERYRVAAEFDVSPELVNVQLEKAQKIRDRADEGRRTAILNIAENSNTGSTGRDTEQGASSRHPKVFISYSWTTPEYREQVKNWADRMIDDGIEVIIDIYDLKGGGDKYAFMERMATDPTVTHVLVFLRPRIREESRR